ncbi:MAG TPA: VWA domain-containing protein, partial [Planctomycetota bacterium]|nr:VWA domain-containing protein [Planctomycetota bacterium]
MTPKSLIQVIFPPPRKRVTLRQALPLIGFLVVFIGIVLFLELGDFVVFTSPGAFLLLLVTPWVWWVTLSSLGGLAGLRGPVALVTRLCLVGVFILLMAEPRSVRKSDVLSVVYALDISDSIGEEASDEALKYVMKTASAVKPENKNEGGLVVFGRDAGVELPPRKIFPFEAINVRIAKDATNLEKGLSLAAAMLPEENQGKIVLISDGTQTEGSLLSVLDDLKARDITVDVLPIEYAYNDEVWLEKLEMPRRVKVGETYEASVVLSSRNAGRGQLTLRENGRVIYQDNVDYNAGKNRYTLPLYLREPGYYEYVAAIEAPVGKDGRTENNTAINYIYLKGEGKVLVVTDPEGDERDWQHLLESIRKADRAVETVGSYEFPRDALSLLPYDCVVFVNVPADAFDIGQLRAVRDAVFNSGVGFLMVGGKNSYGPGGFNRTPVEEALPVTMDIHQRKVLPKGALAIILH